MKIVIFNGTSSYRMVRNKIYYTALFFIAFILKTPSFLFAQSESPYTDLSHYSKVFGHAKSYRLYLPSGYHNSNQIYPVIYFFHGWGGRHFRDDNALLEYEKISELVNKFQVILVMWDGNIEESNPRPYNIGNHKDIIYEVQMKDYFLELISHVDTTYRTLCDRGHRGIIGFSMGGIMSFFLAGKYPDKVCAAVNLAGTPEFFIGYPGNHTLYPLKYTFKNLADVKIRQHGGDSDILVYLNEEVRKGAGWEGIPYEFYRFSGGHMIDKQGETTAFNMAMEFVTGAFGNEVEKPERWSHYDLYNNFKVWNYSVSSNKTSPGFVFLRNLSDKGFGLYTHKWLPDGPPLQDMHITVTTDSCYIPGRKYNIITFLYKNRDPGLIVKWSAIADNEGRLVVDFKGSNFETGIYATGDKPDLITAGYTLNGNCRYLKEGENKLYLTMLNRGGDNQTGFKVLVDVTTRDESVVVHNNSFTVDFGENKRVMELPPVNIVCNKRPPEHGEPFQVKFEITYRFEGKSLKDDITVPVLFNAPVLDSVAVDDGLLIGDKIIGTGNGNGIAEAGERVMLYSGDHRLRLYTNDPWVISEDETLYDEQLPSVWEDSFTLSSIIAISKDCPPGHTINFTASYETVSYNPIERKVHWGNIRLTIPQAH